MDVSAEEYLNWGRTRLRVELKKRGLSPSGLKTELLARLEEYFKRQKASGGGAGHHLSLNNNHNYNHHGSYSNNNNNSNRHSHGHGHQRSSPSSSAPAAGGHSQQQPLLPKQHHSKQLLDLFHHQLQQQQQSEAAALGRELPRKRSRKSQTPRRGLQPQGGSDNTSSEGEGSDHTSGGGSPHSSTSSPSLGGSGGYGSSSSNSSYGSDVIHQTNNSYNHLGNDYPSYYPHKKPRLGQRYSQMTHESDDNGSGSGSGGSGGAVPDGEQQQQSSGGKAAVTPLSGRVFKKESGLVQASHAEVRSVETIVFGPGDQFHFTHRFWRGKLLRRRFDFYGTYTIVPVAGAPVDGAAGGRAAAAGSGDLQLDDLVALSCALAAAGRAGEKDGAAMAKADENRLRERTEGKVILHWPSKLDAPELRDWQFDQSYSHLFLATTAAPSSSSSSTTGGATAGSGGLGSSFDATQPGSTSPVVQGSSASSGPQARKRPHFLYTKHSAVFVEDTC